MTQENFRKLFPDIGKSFRKSLRVMTRFWEKYFFMGTHEIYLEIVSGNFSVPLPEISEFQILFKIIDFGKSFRKIP